MATLIDNETYAEAERLLNAAIHELVFALKHAEDDQVEDANACLVQAQMNIEQVNTKLAAIEAEAPHVPQVFTSPAQNEA